MSQQQLQLLERGTPAPFMIRGHQCRTAADERGNVHVAAADVAAALGVDQNGAQFTRELPDGVLSKHPIKDSLGREQDALCLSMEGVIIACARAKGSVGAEARAALAAGLVEAQRRLSSRPPAVLALFRRARAVHRDAIRLGVLPEGAPLPSWVDAPVELAAGSSAGKPLAERIREWLAANSGFQSTESIRIALRVGAVPVRKELVVLEARGVVMRGVRGGWALA